MLKIAFLIAFCGLLARMAQAQTSMLCNQYTVILPSKFLEKPVTEAVPMECVAPVPPQSVTAPGTAATYSNLKPTTTPSKSCTVGTKVGGYLHVIAGAKATYIGSISGSLSMTDVSSNVNNKIEASYRLIIDANRNLKCTAPPMEEVRVTCKLEQAQGGLIGSIIQAVLDLIKLLLDTLGKLLEATVKSTLPELLAAVVNTVNDILKKLTDLKQMGDGVSCQHEITDMTTDQNGNIKMNCMSNMYSSSGTPIPPPVDMYIPPPIVPAPDSACTFVLPAGWVNHVLRHLGITLHEFTTSALDALSKEISAVCGTATTVAKLGITPTGPCQVAMTKDKGSATQLVRIEIFVSGNSSPFITISLTIQYTTKFSYKKPGVMLHMSFESLSGLKYAGEQPSCDVSNQVSNALKIWLQGNPPPEKCVGASPCANLPIGGTTSFTPGDGCVTVSHN